MNILLQKMMERRGHSPDFLERIERCEHQWPGNIDLLCEHLHVYEQSHEQVVLLTDIDMDGIMSGVLGLAGLSELGFSVALFKPVPDKYGFDGEDIDRLVREYPACKCILTADVGIAAYEGYARAKELGIEMLVTDHHHPMAGREPCGDVFVDPVCDQGEGYYPDFCGAYVLCLVIQRYCSLYRQDAALKKRLQYLTVFAGIATVADMMPVLYENRKIVRYCLTFCRWLYQAGPAGVGTLMGQSAPFRSAFEGLYALLRAFDKDGKEKSPAQIHETFLGFQLIPSVNAVKRMGRPLETAYRVFESGLPEARIYAEALLDLNQQRKGIVSASFASMTDPQADQPYAPYIYLTQAISGVRGLLAQNAMAVSYDPTMVVGEEKDGTGGFVGSGRSPSWFPFLDLCNGKVEGAWAAGHNEAFGVHFQNREALEAFFQFLKKEAQALRPPEEELIPRPDILLSTIPGQESDSPIDPDLFLDFCEACEHLHPFGQSFPEPSIRLTFRPKEAAWRYVSQKTQDHLCLTLENRLPLMLFNSRGLFPEEATIDQFADYLPEEISLYGSFQPNTFRDRTTVQFITRIDRNLIRQMP